MPTNPSNIPENAPVEPLQTPPLDEKCAVKTVHDATSSFLAHDRVGREARPIAETPAPNTKNEARVDHVTQEVMANVSPEGRGVSRSLRRKEKVLLGIAIAVILLIAAGIAIRFGVIGQVIAMLVVLLLAMSPIWGAAILRGQEEKKAEAEAINALHERGRR